MPLDASANTGLDPLRPDLTLGVVGTGIKGRVALLGVSLSTAEA